MGAQAMSVEDLKNVALAAGMDAVEVGKVLDSEPLCQAAVAAGAKTAELEALNTQSDPKTALVELVVAKREGVKKTAAAAAKAAQDAEVYAEAWKGAAEATLEIIPHHETFRTTIQPPYSSTKGYLRGKVRPSLGLMSSGRTRTRKSRTTRRRKHQRMRRKWRTMTTQNGRWRGWAFP